MKSNTNFFITKYCLCFRTSTPDFFYVESAYEPQEVLVIDKKTSKASVVCKNINNIHIYILRCICIKLIDSSNISDEKNYVDPKLSYRPVCGILGTIGLLSGNYLIVATHRIQVMAIEAYFYQWYHPNSLIGFRSKIIPMLLIFSYFYL